MSEKRFTLETISHCYVIKDNSKGEVYYNDLRLLCDLLNSQYNSINIQKKGLDDYRNQIIALSEENEQLRQYADHNGELEFELKQCRTKNKKLQDKIDHLCEKLDKCKMLKEENEQLKEQLKEKEEEEKAYADEILRLNNENYEFLRFKTLGGDY